MNRAAGWVGRRKRLLEAAAAPGTRRAIDEVAHAVRSLPPLAAFRETVSGLGEVDAADAVAALLRLFSETAWLDAALANCIAAARANPLFVPPWRAVGSDIHRAALLVDLPQVAVAASVVTPDALAARKRAGGGRGSVNFGGRRIVFRILRAGGARFSFWRAPRAGNGFRAAAAPPCERIGERALIDGETVVLDTAETSYVVESASRSLVFLQGEVRLGAAPVVREYDAASRRLIGVSSGAEAPSRIEAMLAWLRHAGRADAGPLFAAFARHAPFFLRWRAMREWLALDPDAALPELARMAGADPHPEVRAAAVRTLAMLGERSRMPRLIDRPPGDPIGFDALIAAIDDARFDPRDEEALAALAPLLARLDRGFLGDRLVAELETRCAGQVRGNEYGMQVIMLHRAPGWFVRANFWPARSDAMVRASGTAPFFYGLPHDHNFSFLTLGYSGPGYWSDYYEYDRASVAGHPGEKVELRFAGRMRLEEGRVMLYRAHRDIHRQLPADRLSVSINIVASPEGTTWLDQFRFDVDRGEIAELLGVQPLEPLLLLAAHLGGEAGAGLVDEFARRHPCDRVRFAAIAARASAEDDAEARLEIVARGCADASAQLAGLCRAEAARIAGASLRRGAETGRSPLGRVAPSG